MEFKYSIRMNAEGGINYGAVALLNCDHPHIFALNKPESLLYCNEDSVECLIEAGVVGRATNDPPTDE